MTKKEKNGLEELGLEPGHQDFDYLSKESPNVIGKEDHEGGRLKIVGLASAIVFGLILIFLMFGVRGSKEEAIKKEAPVDLSQKLAELEELKVKVQGLERKLEELTKTQGDMSLGIQGLRKEMTALAQRQSHQGPEQSLRPKEQAKEQAQRTGEGAKAQAQKVHVVQKGESLTSIAKKYDISYKELLRINKITDPDKVVVGQKLKVSP